MSSATSFLNAMKEHFKDLPLPGKAAAGALCCLVSLNLCLEPVLK
jgi:hypothetical protein